MLQIIVYICTILICFKSQVQIKINTIYCKIQIKITKVYERKKETFLPS